MGFPARYSQIPWEKQYYACFRNKVIDPDFLLLVPLEFCGHSVEWLSLLGER